ncbi:GNAT family N-acetyltransferase [Marinomonas sp. THO17]|uniref:GNAT family N-acetyltransferase n=1 Tax=Marinomonas sp. THO17 TaxID=3149048 RepID=UPI00336BF156
MLIMKNFIQIRLAKLSDIDQILQFETKNREWFAQFFPHYRTTPPSEQRLRKDLCGKNAKLHYLVTCGEDKIIGRFNGQFLEYKNNSIEVSYRLDKAFINLGIAKYALKHLLLIWSSQGIQEIYATVGDYNKPSIRVLLSCGFFVDEFCPSSVNLHSKIEDGWVFRWSDLVEVKEGAYKSSEHQSYQRNGLSRQE